MLIELKRCKPWWFKKEESMKGMKVYKESRKVFVCVCVCIKMKCVNKQNKEGKL